ncbi:UDP-glucuronosyl/UDP-glucosyltransferase [Parasponia andersonii]|uniref:7-deoxyloganetic acid glucosyltransferase n=1 Tax=Parasponia andersonii TaxID=3476 RepID=A0A2P5C644_PARAD|nr:UDP-glucuronosyl/UDP-glucosyltransferase [Parasponia andersonii]
MENQEQQTIPRVLIFPLAAQGHVNSMLKLAELLALAGLHVTFLNTDHIHNRLIRHTDIQTRFSKYPGFLFRTISDGLEEDHPRTGDRFMEVVYSLNDKTKPILREMLVSGKLGSADTPLVTYIISDGIFGGFTIDVAEELGIPIIHFRTVAACCFLSYFFFPDLIESGELPIRGKEDMDRLIKSVPGMEGFLRCRDLPGFCRVSDATDPCFRMIPQVTNQSRRARALILNTFEGLEGPIVSRITKFCPKIYTLGPLHAHLNARLANNTNGSTSQSSNCLYDVDRSCLTWLDSQPLKSVIYVSFGSITVFTKHDLMEIWYGLVNSKQRFLWVIRPDLVEGEGGDDMVPVELVEATRERGYMAGYVPQEEVLAHRAVGGFLTHSGWNSTLESIVAGVPMICWPYFADQNINSRFVSEVWKFGLDMKDVCDRKVVEKMVNDLMVERREDFEKSTAEMAKLAKNSVSEGGSSYSNLERLIEDIRFTAKSRS